VHARIHPPSSWNPAIFQLHVGKRHIADAMCILSAHSHARTVTGRSNLLSLFECSSHSGYIQIHNIVSQILIPVISSLIQRSAFSPRSPSAARTFHRAPLKLGNFIANALGQ
jgi:hypothetical protein